MILLEVLAGQRIIDPTQVVKNQCIDSLIDSTQALGVLEPEQREVLTELMLNLLELQPHNRPEISTVVEILGYLL